MEAEMAAPPKRSKYQPRKRAGISDEPLWPWPKGPYPDEAHFRVQDDLRKVIREKAAQESKLRREKAVLEEKEAEIDRLLEETARKEEGERKPFTYKFLERVRNRLKRMIRRMDRMKRKKPCRK
jgi:hypothetical protein